MTDKATLFMEDTLEEAFYFLQHKDMKLAKKFLKKACNKYPRHHLAFYGQGLFACSRSDHVKATELFKKSIEVKPDHALSHYNMAIAWKNLGEYDHVVKHYYEAVKHADEDTLSLIPDAVDIINTLKESLPAHFSIDDYMMDAEKFQDAYQLMNDKQYQDAILLFQGIANNQPDHAQSRGNIGICHMSLNNLDEAEKFLNEALAIDPDYQPASDNLIVLRKLQSGEL